VGCRLVMGIWDREKKKVAACMITNSQIKKSGALRELRED